MSGIASDDKTHVRITNGVAELITWGEASDEVNAAQMGPKHRRLVRTMSSDDNGRTHHIDYYDGRKVTIRDAVDADQPVESAPEAQNLQTHTGVVHAPGRYSNALRGNRPLCCTSEYAVSRYHYLVTVSSAVTCKRCDAALAKQAAK